MYSQILLKMNELKTTLNVEVLLKANCTSPKHVVETYVDEFLSQGDCGQHATVYGDLVFNDFGDHRYLRECIERITVYGSEDASQKHSAQTQNFAESSMVFGLDLKTAELLYHIYQLNYEEPSDEGFSNGGDGIEESDMSVANQWLLPSSDFHGLWESLVFDSDIKTQLLNYVSSMLLFSDHGVDSKLVSWNRVVLLHGPPGTGKTSLCRALAQKVFIRNSRRYKYGQLIEINSHGLFSKWFSESGKLVARLFRNLKNIIRDSDALVILLLDEVESLTNARKSAMAGSEPSDAIRVVNALLTQIDSILRYPNVLILTTSNITEAIDLAFVDRADVKQYVGLPSAAAIYSMYLSATAELIRAKIICPGENLMTLRALQLAESLQQLPVNGCSSSILYDIARRSRGLSGRTLKRLPLLAHALFTQSPTMSMETYLSCLRKAIEKQFQEKREMGQQHTENTERPDNRDSFKPS